MTSEESALLAQVAMGLFSVDEMGAIWRHFRLSNGSALQSRPLIPVDPPVRAEVEVKALAHVTIATMYGVSAKTISKIGLRKSYPPHPRIHWLISGCESGPGARPCDVAWLRSLRDQCAAVGVPYFLKQAEDSGGDEESAGLGAVAFDEGSSWKAGRIIELPYLDGHQHAAFPEVG